MKSLSAEQMRAAERAAAEAGLSEEKMMEHAGLGAARIIEAEFRRRPGCRRVVIAAGKGNNAGDGLVAAGALACPVAIAAAAPLDTLKGAAAHHAKLLPASVPVIPAEEATFGRDDLIVDALLGTGCTGAVREPLAGVIRRINASGAPVVALDLPSGLNADTGEAALAVTADLTITFGAPKRGLVMGRGPELAGSIRLAGIGIPEERFAGDGPDLFTEADAAPLLGRLPYDTHKNRRGRVLAAAGSARYPGAAMLTVLGALRTGAGYVRLAFPGAMPPLPAAVVRLPLPATSGGTFGRAAIPALLAALAEADAVAAGSGWGRHAELETVLNALIDHAPRGVLDAEGLRLLPFTGRTLGGNWILTPHPGEAAALLAALDLPETLSRIEIAQILARRFDAITVLKGPQSVTAAPDGRVSLNASGSPALAVAGSGDVLTGVAAALLAAGLAPFDAARLAAYLHGRAGETAPRRGLIADDLPALVREAMAELSPVC